MKKIMLSMFAVIALAVAVNAQAGLRLGIKGGGNFTQLQGNGLDGSYKVGYQLGGFMEIDFSKAIGIQPEVLFSESAGRTASNANSVYTGLNGNQDINLNYLSIPVLLRLNASKMVTFLVGPQYSILVNNHQTTLQNGQQAFSNGDFAMVGGLQLNLGALRIYGRYDIGLNSINDLSDKDKWTSQQVQLGLGIRL